MLTKDDNVRGLRKLDAKAKASAVIVDMAVYGGAALALVFDLRQATRDVDAVVHGAPDFLRRAVAEVADEEGWPVDWLNDGVRVFVARGAAPSIELVSGIYRGWGAAVCAGPGVFVRHEVYGNAA